MKILAIVFSTLFLTASFAHAQTEGLALTVTPPLFQLTIGPGESWSSSLKVVNSNPYDVAYYTQVVDFVPEGEGGQSSFLPLVSPPPGEATSTASLAGWIEVTSGPFTIPRGTSGDVPFTVNVPIDAPPGGHYAAILVGTEPGKRVEGGPSMRISSMVSTLMFVRIKGEVIETGRIREFRTIDELYQTARADFVLRFENTGNAHLRPQGAVTIYNMWGKERGKVLINEKGEFGNALPQSTRRYEFSWEGENSLFDIGRYRAEATLTYGQEAKQNATYATYFWVVPVIPVAITLGAIFFFIVVAVWLIRRYIRRSLEQYGIAPQGGRVVPTVPQPMSFVQFVATYGATFTFACLVILATISIWFYFDDVLTKSRAFEVTEVTSAEE
jgi:membrane protein implicated in regulation of membrane protease activity